MVKQIIRKLVAHVSMTFLASSAIVGTVMAEAVPELGKYIAEGGNYSIEITSANSSNGQIEGTYHTNFSQAGELNVTGKIGQYHWVYSNSQGKDGVAPFGIRFQIAVRPDKRAYNIFDNWTGAYQINNTLLMSGVRSYVNNKGTVEVISLGTKKFFK